MTPATSPAVQRGRLHTLTARTFHGKTTAMICMLLCVAARINFADLRTEQARCVLLAAENPDDKTARRLPR